MKSQGVPVVTLYSGPCQTLNTSYPKQVVELVSNEEK